MSKLTDAGYFDPDDLRERWAQLYNCTTFVTDPSASIQHYVTIPMVVFDEFNRDLPKLIANATAKRPLVTDEERVVVIGGILLAWLVMTIVSLIQGQGFFGWWRSL